MIIGPSKEKKLFIEFAAYDIYISPDDGVKRWAAMNSLTRGTFISSTYILDRFVLCTLMRFFYVCFCRFFLSARFSFFSTTPNEPLLLRTILYIAISTRNLAFFFQLTKNYHVYWRSLYIGSYQKFSSRTGQ